MESLSDKFEFFSISSVYFFQTEFIANYGVFFLLLLVSVYLLFPAIKQKYTEYKNIRTIKSLGKYQLHNLAIQFNLDETVYIDHVILIPEGIFILNVMKYNGIIFAGENVEQWTQLINKRSYKFQNPLHDLEVCVSAIRGIVENCKVIGHIAFESNCQFPKGKPANISLLHEMQNELEFLNGDITTHMEDQWTVLKESNMCTSNIKQNDLSILVKAEQKSTRIAVGLLLLTGSLLMLIYQMAEFTIIENLFS